MIRCSYHNLMNDGSKIMKHWDQNEALEILEILKELVFDLYEGKMSRSQTANILMAAITPVVMANLPTQGTWDMIQSLYWSLLHLTNEGGFETTDDEIEYFIECFRGNRVYSNDDFNKFLKERFKNRPKRVGRKIDPLIQSTVDTLSRAHDA